MSAALRHEVPHHMTVDEFLDWASGAPGKWQLVDGERRAMAPASATHGIIQARLATMSINVLDAMFNSCVVVSEPAIVPQIRASSNMRVPDLAVTCATVQAGQIAVQEPVLACIRPGLPPSCCAAEPMLPGSRISIRSVPRINSRWSASVSVFHSRRCTPARIRRKRDHTH